jgi:cysteine desulfurase
MMYLDANAHTPMSKKAQQAYINFQNSVAAHGHPSSPNAAGRAAALELENARCKIANLIGAKSSNQIIFTSTCTQACEWAISILEKKNINEPIYYSPVEHSAIKYAVEKETNRHTYKKLKTNSDGVIEYQDAKYVICLKVQNEIGTIQPIEQWNNSYIVSDLCQVPGKTDININNISIGTFGAHKFSGPAGVGFLYLKNPEDWMQFGTGSRYYADRPGTPDVGSVVATSEALEETLINAPEKQQKCKEFQYILEEKLIDMGLEVIGKNTNRVFNTSFIKIPNIAMMVLMELSQSDIIVGLGSACGSMHTGDSPLMKAIGGCGSAHDFIRISQEGYYGRKEALIVVDQINKAIRKHSAN